jgi:hypothetical protein
MELNFDLNHKLTRLILNFVNKSANGDLKEHAMSLTDEELRMLEDYFKLSVKMVNDAIKIKELIRIRDNE